MKSILTLSLLLLSIFSFGQSKKSDPLAEAKAAIAESNAIYFTSFEKHDATIFIDRYADDACIMMPNAPHLCGKTEIENFFKAAYDEFGLRGGKFVTTAVYGDGKEYVTEEGLWQSLNQKGELIDDGKFLVLWKKTPKGWKMYRDSFSTNRQQ